MTEPSFFDFFNGIMKSMNITIEHKKDFFIYMENYIIFTLVEIGFRSDISFDCLVAALFFFKANGDTTSLDAVLQFFRSKYLINLSFFRRYDKAVEQMAASLKALNNNAHTVDSIVEDIDPRRIFI